MHDLKVSEMIALDREIKQKTKQLDALKAELQAEANAQMEDRNIKYVEYHSPHGSAVFTRKAKFEIDNYERLAELIGEQLAADKISREEAVKYKTDSKLQAALIALYVGEYQQHDLTGILQGLGLDDKQIKVVLKKLRGDYWRDRKLLAAYGAEGDLEEELDAIHEQKNWELISRYIDPASVDREKLQLAVSVEEGLAVALNYGQED